MSNSTSGDFCLFISAVIRECAFAVCFCVLFSNFYSELKVTAKNWSDLCNFYSKVIFWIFLSKKIFFYFSLLNFNY